ncbi:MAG: CobW family GTP-binding protein, partial [Burkholderiales bacterium]
AEPGPVAHTFFMDEDINDQYVLDAVITVVDAKHGNDTLSATGEARAQVGFADRLLLSKTDLVSEEETQQLIQRLRKMNPRATVHKVNFGTTDLKEILDIRGFNLNAILEVEPDFLTADTHSHADDVQSFVWKDARPLDMQKIEAFLSLLIQTYGVDMLRYKGVLNIEGEPRRMIFQGVHMLMGGTPGKPWAADEVRESKMVFIGRNLPKKIFVEGLAYCVADGAKTAIETR